MSKSPEAFRTIREVADWLGVAAHVLRFWESKFSQIRPVKRAGGRRYYRPADMELVGGIKVLLHDRGMTIRGVQRMIREEGAAAVAALSPSIDDMGVPGELIDGIADEAAWKVDAEAEAASPAAEPEPEPEPEPEEASAPEPQAQEPVAPPPDMPPTPAESEETPEAAPEPETPAQLDPEPAPEPEPEDAPLAEAADDTQPAAHADPLDQLAALASAARQAPIQPRTLAAMQALQTRLATNFAHV
jgi:DNA-binding transcriptional MerR regulator